MHRWSLVISVCIACGAPPRVEIAPVATSTTCRAADLDGEPLVVDLDAIARADLDGALSHGIVAVRYDCDGVKVLPDCIAAGAYAFVGVDEKEQVTRFTSATEVRANFPTNAAPLERTRAGRELDFGLAVVGSLNAQRATFTRDDFKGRCEGATHFIRRATVGAFGIGSGAPNAKVDVESLLASGQDHDGSMQACRAAVATGDAAPRGCSATLRVVLDAMGSSSPAEERARRCQDGTVLDDDGQCRAPTAVAYHLCDPANLSDCETQCVKGSMGSCAIAGRTYEIGRGVPVDETRAKALLKRACDGGSAQGCHRLGEVRLRDNAVEDARALFEKSCSAGWLPGCESFGQLGLASASARIDAFTAFKRACAGGNYESCASLGKLHEIGLGGVPKDETKAVALYTLACDSGRTRRACVSLSVMIEQGRGIAAPDPARSNAILERACYQQGSSDSCGMLSLHYFQGQGVPRDSGKGVELLIKACEGDDRGSCLPLAMRYRAGVGVPKDAERAKKYFTRACDSGIALACEQAR